MSIGKLFLVLDSTELYYGTQQINPNCCFWITVVNLGCRNTQDTKVGIKPSGKKGVCGGVGVIR